MRVLYWLVGLGVTIFLLVHFYFPRWITQINEPVLSMVAPQPVLETLPTSQTIHYRSNDGYQLVASVQESKQQPTKATIVFLHGIRGSKQRFYKHFSFFTEQGFRVVAPDLRAHGESEGTHCTFGEKEKIDISLLLDELHERKYNEPIVLWGQSLGGAVALQTMASDHRVAVGIIESTFSDFAKIPNEYVQHFTGLSFPPITSYALQRSAKLADYHPYQIKPFQDCEAITNPVLLVHGSDDGRINIYHAKKNFQHLNTEFKELKVIKHAKHEDVWSVGGEDYLQQATSFIDRHLPSSMEK